jgi:biofilm PGA synthesis protein PgaD
MDHKALIIDSPDLQLAPQRRSWAFVKSVGWLLWFMLWLPLLTLLGWYFGYETVIEQFVDRKGSIELRRLLPTYLLVIGVCGGSLVLWSLIQYWRFHGRNRRNSSPDLATSELAEMTKTSVAAVQSWQGARRVVAYHDANAKIVTVETDPNALYGKALIAAVEAAEALTASQDGTTVLTVTDPPASVSTHTDDTVDTSSSKVAGIATVQHDADAGRGEALAATAEIRELITIQPAEALPVAINAHADNAVTPSEGVESVEVPSMNVAEVVSIAPVVIAEESAKVHSGPKATTTDIATARKAKARRTKKRRATGSFG